MFRNNLEYAVEKEKVLKSTRRQFGNRSAIIALVAGVVLALIVIGLILTAPGVVGSKRLSVVAAENPWGNIASQIGGNKVHVTSILSNPNVDPHLYESDALDAAEVSSAKIVIKNGLGYDDFIDKLVAGSGRSDQIKIVSAASVLNVTGSDPNPHLWYAIADVPQVASAIEGAMASEDPSNQSYYAQNLTEFDNSLMPINSVMNEIKSKYAGQPVAYTERVAGYLLQEAGLKIVTPTGFARSIEDGTEPSPADTEAMENLISAHSIKVLLYNVQTVSSVTDHIKSLARQNKIPVVGVSETLPPGKTYQTWQHDQADAILTALGG